MRVCVALLMLLYFGVSGVFAEDEADYAWISESVPLGFMAEGEVVAFNDEYAVIKHDSNLMIMFTAVVVNREDGEILGQYEYIQRVYFVSADLLLLMSGLDTQAPRLYHLPDMAEVGRLPLDINPIPRQYGKVM